MRAFYFAERYKFSFKDTNFTNFHKTEIILEKGRIAPKKWDETVTYFVNLKEEKAVSSTFPILPEHTRIGYDFTA